MSGLNPDQHEAVNTLSGPLLVLAGAGTGKTRVITFRIAKLIKSGVPGERILGMTFTNKAANEMKERLGKMLGVSLGKPYSSKSKKSGKISADHAPTISTFHSLCVRILRRQIEPLGYPLKFAIYNRGDQEGLARSVLREINVSDKLLAPSQLLYWIGHWKCKSLTPAQAEIACETDAQHLAAIGYKRYQRQLKLMGAVDFDDLLLLTEKLFNEYESVRAVEAGRFDHILVDEYQDTNTSQYRIVKALAEHRNLCVVGDDDQSIYGWRGAEVEHILSFNRDWPDAKVVRLEDNYRSTEAIIEVANTLIKFNKTRHDKVLRAARSGGEKPAILQYPNETVEAQETVHSIRKRLEQKGREPRDFAILFRTNEQPRIFETELRKAKLPYILVGGMSFFDRKEVKDLLAYLRLIGGSPDEVSVLRIINTPPRGIGKKSIEVLLKHAIDHKVSLWDLVTGAEERPPLNPKTLRGIEDLASQIEETLYQTEDDSLVDLSRNLIQNIRYRNEINRIYSEPEERESRWAVVEQIVNSLSEYEQSAAKPRLDDFLDKLLLGEQDANDEKEKQLKKNAIALMTMHSAKGLEFPEVYIVGLEEGILPHHRSLENDASVDEERRLCYVGVTRAEERLTLSMSLTRLKWGKPRDTKPSRFLYELTGKADHPNYQQPRGT
ncbi:MAG: UvrD-helicase domain-containing protein [Mariniblastus sp.]|nr:UvrD-helicase domain-containing protein [Mariniblastus sp.]